jgi:hypothetical protein
MRYSFLLAVILSIAAALSARAAEKPRTAQGNQNQPKKVWTNDDMDQLRERGLISIVGQEAPATTAEAVAPSAPAAYASRFEDPEWYAQKAADLQAELDERAAALQEAQANLAQVAKGITQPGIAMDKKNVGVTPEAGIAILDAQAREVQSQLDELSNLARQNNIPPGVLRG